MITSIIILIGFIIAGFVFINGDKTVTKPDYRGNDREVANKALYTKIVGILVITFIASLIQPYKIERIDAGQKGIVVNLSGSARGVQAYQYQTGWVLYNAWFKQVLEFPIFQQHIEYDDQIVILKGGFQANIKPTFNYSLKEDAIGDMFVNLRRDIKDVEQGWLKTAIVGAVNDVANTWEVDSIFNHRQQFEASIVAECNVRLSKWFNVSQLRTNITPPEALQESIIAKTKAIQQAEASEQQAIAAISEGRRKVAVARADSAETIINANATAQAIKIKQNQITPTYIEYLKAQAWDGKLPTTVAGGSGMFLNIR